MKIIKWKIIKLDDIKVRYKLALLYFLGLLIPVLITNYWLYSIINNSIRNEQVNSINESMNRIMYNLKGDFDNSVVMTDVFYNDNSLNLIMDRAYQNEDEYIDAYNGYLKNFITKYLPLYNQISNVNVYADNSSILSGGGYEYLSSSVKEQAWYKLIQKSQKRIEILAYYDAKAPNIFKYSGRNISLFRKLNGYAGEKSVEKFLKIDMNYGVLKSRVTVEGVKGDVFVIDPNDNIILSNNSYYTNASQDYITFSSYNKPKNNITMEKPLEGVLTGWKVIISVRRAGILSSMLNSRLNLLALLLLNMILPSLLILFISRSFNRRLDLISKHIKHVEVEDFKDIECSQGEDEIGQVIKEFNRMAVKIKELIKDVYQERIKGQNVEIARQQAELNALQSQINPHFLFNTLETIRMRSLLKKEGETSEIIMHLSKMLRRTLTWGDDLVSISDEVTLIEDFLKIQKYRFGDKLNYKIYVQENAAVCLVPKLSIQTFVENACIHGIEGIAGKGLVEVCITREDNHLNVIVKDNGIGIPEKKLEELLKALSFNTEHTPAELNIKSVGMRNVCTRLNIFYKTNFEINVMSKENIGTEVKFRIPATEK